MSAASRAADECLRATDSDTTASTLTVANSLAEAKTRGVDRLDAQLLLERVLARPRSWLLAHDDAELTAEQAVAFLAGVRRRLAGEPLAYVLGEKEFHGLMLEVNPYVLIPRPETETLVDWGIELLAGALANVPTPRVLDLGTGSGAIALALKHRQPHACVSALDVSRDALEVAKSNAARLGLAVNFHQGHWWDGLSGQQFHLVVSNPPYIDPGDPHLAVLQHEPRLALTAGGRGLDALAAIASGAREHLEPGGWLLFEHGYDQAAPVQALLRHAGFPEPLTRRDLAGHTRCTGAHR